MKTLFLLHGFGLSSRVWEDVSYELSSHYRVFAPDLPGHGETVVPFAGIRKSAECLANVIREGEMTALNVVGWSMGGQIAIELCDILPRRISSLILAGSTPKFTSEHFEHGYSMAVFRKFHKALKHDHVRAMRGFYKLMFSNRERASDYIDFLIDQMPSKETLLKSMESLKSEDQIGRLSGIKAPTLLLSGSLDAICSSAASKFMAQKIPRSRMMILKGAGHALHLTRHKEFVNAARNFIK